MVGIAAQNCRDLPTIFTYLFNITLLLIRDQVVMRVQLD